MHSPERSGCQSSDLDPQRNTCSTWSTLVCGHTQVSRKQELQEAPLTLLRAWRRGFPCLFRFLENALVLSISRRTFLVTKGFWKAPAVAWASVLWHSGRGPWAQIAMPCSRPASAEKICRSVGRSLDNGRMGLTPALRLYTRCLYGAVGAHGFLLHAEAFNVWTRGW